MTNFFIKYNPNFRLYWNFQLLSFILLKLNCLFALILSDQFISKIRFQTLDNPEVFPSKKSIHYPLPFDNISWAKGKSIQSTLLVYYTLGTPTRKQTHPPPFNPSVFIINLLLHVSNYNLETSPISHHKGQATCPPIKIQVNAYSLPKSMAQQMHTSCLFNHYIRPPLTNSLV
jgi:hypothetical protein